MGSWPASDILDLMEYDGIQPFGSERDNWHAATIAQTIGAVFTPKGKTPPRVSDFMWKDERTRKREAERELLRWLRTVKKRGDPS